ncbi:hypothetical protein [Pseudonocardia sp. GCM10023141]|uniref:hypothetical protein n=1 Tax=Pseudonocardia sp. GCM10023141 TaxID=3252653 RepID=UPI00360FF03C
MSVVLDLAGSQDVAIAEHQPGTEFAAVTVRVGSALIYLHDMATVEKFVNAFFDLAPSARRLQREIDPRIVAPVGGMPEPGVIINVADAPIPYGTLLQQPGSYAVVRLQVGRLVLRMHDLGAYSSTTAAFRAAASVGIRTFRDAPDTFHRSAPTAAATGKPSVQPSRRQGRSHQEARQAATPAHRVGSTASRPRSGPSVGHGRA